MRATKRSGLAFMLAFSLFLSLGTLMALGSEMPAGRTSKAGGPHPLAHYIAMLKSGKAQEKAAAAYWLGQQHGAAAVAVDPLVDLLGDVSEINPAEYRVNKLLQKLTLGEEAAAALVNIGHPAIDPLIRVLKTSPLPQARKNAAWALGALHEVGSTTTI